jgi:SAM-dependent methyltransferase
VRRPAREPDDVPSVAPTARYDGVADWFDRELATAPAGVVARDLAAELLGAGTGALLDVGCGTGAHAAAWAGLGWDVTGIDVSADQLRLARERGVRVVQGRAEELPFADESFAAAVSTWTHTDVDDFPTEVREVVRVLRPGGRFAYVGAHPCFVGPHARFERATGIPELHPGYRRTGFYTEAPGTRPDGLRARVGATHQPLDGFLQTFLDAALVLERIVERGGEGEEYPFMLGLRARRP